MSGADRFPVPDLRNPHPTLALPLRSERATPRVGRQQGRFRVGQEGRLDGSSVPRRVEARLTGPRIGTQVSGSGHLRRSPIAHVRFRLS